MAKSIDKNLSKLPLGAIRADGWLLSELKLMNVLQKKIGALQGLIKNGEWPSGESLPRYVRGLILLAAALDDKTLKDKAVSFMQPIFNSAIGGGDFGPKEYRSITPKIEAIKTLLDYYNYVGDEKALPFLKRYFKNQYNTYTVSNNWFDSRARLLETIPALEAVYRETDLEWLQDLGEKLRDSSCDWFKFANKYPYRKSYKNYISLSQVKKQNKLNTNYAKVDEQIENPKLKPLTNEMIEKQWKSIKHQNMVMTSGVNIAKAVKYPAVYGRFVGDDDLKTLSLKLIDSLNKYHGSPLGMFNCDSRIEETSSTNGIDIQATVEYIESLVEVIKETGSYECCDILERIIFNIIPGACLEDCSAMQDMLLVNQVEASVDRRLPYSDEEYSNAYLTKKASKGALAVLSAFPLFMQTLCMTKGEELNFMTYAPSTMDIFVGGTKLTISEKTSYPFRNSITFKVEKADGEPEVKMNFRVPKNTTMQLISGGQVVASGTKQISVKCILKAGSTFMLKLSIPLVAEEGIGETYMMFKGNVAMALKVPGDITINPEDRRILKINLNKKWGIAPILSKKVSGGVRTPADDEKTIINEIGENPFSQDNPPFEIKVRSKNVMNWDYDVNGFTLIPKKCIFSEENLERTYIPFGCSNLRISTFPKCIR